MALHFPHPFQVQLFAKAYETTQLGMDQSNYPGGFSPSSGMPNQDERPFSFFYTLDQQYANTNASGIAQLPVDTNQQQMMWIAQPSVQHTQHMPGWYDDPDWTKVQAIQNSRMPLVQCKDTHGLDFQYLEACQHAETVRHPSPQLSEWDSASQRSSLSSPYTLSEHHAYTYFGNGSSHPIKIEDGTGRAEQPALDVPSPYGATRGTSECEDSLHSHSASPVITPSYPATSQGPGSFEDRDNSKFKPMLEASHIDSAQERRKRSYTTEETAKCYCKTCGKLFRRIYNLNAHLDTHLESRPHPHQCTQPGCGKRFVRKTDLIRHEQSVCSEL